MTTIGPFNITGNDAQVAKITPMAQKIANVLGPRIKNVNVTFLAKSQMPWADQGAGIRSVGFTPNAHNIELSAGLHHFVPDTFAHECCHVLDFQWFSAVQRNDILALELPPGAKWDPHGYEGDGQETWAVYGAAALFGAALAWKNLYTHSIPQSSYAQLVSIALKDYGSPTPPPPPVPTGPDPAELQAQIDDLTAQLATANTTIATLQTKIKAAQGDLA